MDWSMLGFPVFHYHSDFAQILIHWGSDAIQLCYSLSPPSPLALSLSQHQGLFQWICYLYQVAKVLDLQLQHQSFPWIFRVDKFDLLVVQGTLKSLLHHHSLEASVLQHSTFFMVQLSHSYMTTGKIIALTKWTFVSKVTFCFLICCLGLSPLFFQGASVF